MVVEMLQLHLSSQEVDDQFCGVAWQYADDMIFLELRCCSGNEELRFHLHEPHCGAAFPALRQAEGYRSGCVCSFRILTNVQQECFKNVMQPVMLGWVVRYFAHPESITKTEFYLSAAGVSILGGMHIFTHHPYFFNMQRMGMRIRIACCSLVYRKVCPFQRSTAA
ncbi:hypothetical protein HPB50_021581 [Hyalomma asiaticum]|uniref:Uncharacterized protein n=1 Tax=Hyalomma asiaticum TaxID=266040 RepID=A0ACB7T0D4_HYAAI|nr:hypothetical protein HPB50_021581 [Hyalomma asiaticum]